MFPLLNRAPQQLLSVHHRLLTEKKSGTFLQLVCAPGNKSQRHGDTKQILTTIFHTNTHNWYDNGSKTILKKQQPAPYSHVSRKQSYNNGWITRICTFELQKSDKRDKREAGEHLKTPQDLRLLNDDQGENCCSAPHKKVEFIKRERERNPKKLSETRSKSSSCGLCVTG